MWVCVCVCDRHILKNFFFFFSVYVCLIFVRISSISSHGSSRLCRSREQKKQGQTHSHTHRHTYDAGWFLKNANCSDYIWFMIISLFHSGLERLLPALREMSHNLAYTCRHRHNLCCIRVPPSSSSLYFDLDCARADSQIEFNQWWRNHCKFHVIVCLNS